MRHQVMLTTFHVERDDAAARSNGWLESVRMKHSLKRVTRQVARAAARLNPVEPWTGEHEALAERELRLERDAARIGAGVA
jgi:hypothetical protein